MKDYFQHYVFLAYLSFIIITLVFLLFPLIKLYFTKQLKKGDEVKIFVKKDKMDKQHIPSWSEYRYEIEDIVEKMNQTFYKIKNRDRLYLRNEMLKV